MYVAFLVLGNSFYPKVVTTGKIQLPQHGDLLLGFCRSSFCFPAMLQENGTHIFLQCNLLVLKVKTSRLE